MKTKPSNTPGFTLIEILVVIAIIVTLMSISVPIVIRQIHVGKETEARAYMKDIDTAMGLYLQDNHDIFPTATETYYPPQDRIRYLATSQGAHVVRALTGTYRYSERHNNPKQKVYFSSRRYDWGQGGKHTDQEISNHFIDPWGDGYNFYIDFSGDGVLDFENDMPVEADHPAFNTRVERRYGSSSRGHKGVWNQNSLLSWK